MSAPKEAGSSSTSDGEVRAEIESREVTIHEKEGVDQVTVRGTVKNFASGFRRYLEKGPKAAQIAIEINTGRYPDFHPTRAKEWAVQIMIAGCDTEEEAAILADRIKPHIREWLNPPAVKLGKPKLGRQ